MISKQLLVGLTVGALGAGFGFMLFGGEPAADVSRTDGLNLLAQVIPNEPALGPESEEEVIEVRAVAPPVKASAPKITTVSAAEEPEPENDPEAGPAAEHCAYQTGDRPQRLGIISEVAWMGTGDDANAEWVEIQNRLKGELDVSGWQLVDKAQQIQAIVPAGVKLARNGFLVFERDEHRLQGVTVLYKGVISNADEGLRLFDADCNLQDEVIAGSSWPAGTNKPKHTAERGKDLSWHTYYGDEDAGVFGTPGSWNSAGPPPEPEPEPEEEQEEEALTEADEEVASSSESEAEVSAPVVISAGQLIISEVMAGTEASSAAEFVELFNMTDAEISLDGFSIKKKASTGTESTLVADTRFFGKSVAAGGRFVVAHDGYFTDARDAVWPSSYSLAAANNAVVLYNAQAEKIDEVAWTDMAAGQSYACASLGSCAAQEVPNPGE